MIDVDTGVDDALALSYAINSKDLEVIGITTCHGNVSVENATNNTSYLLDVLNRSDIPIAQGASHPIFKKRTKDFSTHFHGPKGLGEIDTSKVVNQQTQRDATTFLTEMIRKYPHEITFISLGSLTNLAKLVLQNPDIVPLIKEVIIMGGAVTVPGNQTMHAEANILADPEAANIVVHAGLNITLVGLDVTMQSEIGLDDLKRWKAKDSKHANLIADITKYYIENGYNVFSDDRVTYNHCSLHDPLAVAVAIDDTLVKKVPLYVTVDLEGVHSYARTVPDMRKGQSNKPNMNVCLEVDSNRFVDHFLMTVTK